jgi:adenylate cyclase
MTARSKLIGTMAASLSGIASLVAVVLLQVADFAPLNRVRMQVFDAYQTASPRESSGAHKIAIVDIDEESIAQLGQWPWPRTDLAALTDRLGQAGARAVVFDIVFSEPDRTSPAVIAARYESMGHGKALGGGFADLPSHDALLAESFAEVPVVTGFFLDRTERGRDVEPKAGFTLHGSLPTKHVESYDGALLPLPEIETAAAGNGFVSLEGDPDGIVRRIPLVAIHRGTLVPALSLEALRVALGAGSPDLLASDGSGESSSAPGAAVAIRLDGKKIPVTEAGEMWLHYPEARAQDMLTAWPIVTGEMADDLLARAVKGRIVFIGGSAAGLQDLVSTPLSARVAGVVVHAAAAEQILADDFLERPDWAFGLELVLVLLFGGMLAFLLPRLGAAKGALAAIVGIGTIIAGSCLAFTRVNYLLDPTYPVFAIAAIYAVQTLVVFYREERQRRYIHSAFDRYLAPEIVRQIAADPEKLELGGEERDMSVLMCDIRGFSRMSEQYSPKQVIDFLISFLTPMSDILLARRATLDKYIGDAVLAFWNAPLDDPHHHRNAACAALEMIAKVEELNRSMPDSEAAVWPGEVKIGIGINSGLCCVGNMGSRQRLSYSLIGDTVNMAARLEGLTKQYGVPIIVGSAIAERLEGSMALLPLDRVRVVGREAVEDIYVLCGDEELRAQDEFGRLALLQETMLDAYRSRQWKLAQSVLADAAGLYEAHGLGGVRDLFMQRITRLRENPPPDGWSGVFEATEK